MALTFDLSLSVWTVVRSLSTGSEQPVVNRLWTDATGKFKVKAKLVTKTPTTVTLLTEAGKTVELPMSKLSEADQNFLKQGSASDANPFE